MFMYKNNMFPKIKIKSNVLRNVSTHGISPRKDVLRPKKPLASFYTLRNMEEEEEDD